MNSDPPDQKTNPVQMLRYPGTVRGQISGMETGKERGGGGLKFELIGTLDQLAR